MHDSQPTQDSAPVLVTVAVLTFHRPEQVRETVALLHRQTSAVGAPWQAEVLVVDNDPAASGREAVEGQQLDDVRYVVEPTPGIAAARNRALDEARGRDVLLFLDDDGRPGEQWLQRMLERWRETGAAAVAGWVDTRYLGEVDPWIEAGRFFSRTKFPDGAERPAAACGNLLIDLRQLGEHRFARDLGMSGGEDTLLTKQMVARGGRIVFCADAPVIDQVAAERITRQWVLLRAMSHGNTGGILDLYLSDSRLARPKLAVDGIVRLAGGGARTALGTVRRNQVDQARGARAAMRGLGMTLAAAGLSYQEYSSEKNPLKKLVRSPQSLPPHGHHDQDAR